MTVARGAVLVAVALIAALAVWLLLGGGGELWLKDETNIQIGGDGTGAGTFGGFDAARQVSLDNLVPADVFAAASSPTQGLHVRLTVRAPGLSAANSLRFMTARSTSM